MYGRVKVEDRAYFYEEDREQILLKSRGKCAHCGKKLSVSNMTVDHAIPISKAGSNNKTNLVALCKECNVDKTNYIVDPERYFKYITPKFLKELKHNFDVYCKEIDYLGVNSLFKTDIVDVPSKLPVMLNNGKPYIQDKVMTFKRALKDDLDEIKDYIRAYYKAFNTPITDKEIAEDVNSAFKRGVIMYSRSANGKILVLLVSNVTPAIKVSDDKEPIHLLGKGFASFTISHIIFIRPDVNTIPNKPMSVEVRNAMFIYTALFQMINGIVDDLKAKQCIFQVSMGWVTKDKRVPHYLSREFDSTIAELSQSIHKFDESLSCFEYQLPTPDLADIKDTVRGNPYEYVSNGSRFLYDNLRTSRLYKDILKYILEKHGLIGVFFQHDFSENAWNKLMSDAMKSLDSEKEV